MLNAQEYARNMLVRVLWCWTNRKESKRNQWTQINFLRELLATKSFFMKFCGSTPLLTSKKGLPAPIFLSMKTFSLGQSSPVDLYGTLTSNNYSSFCTFKEKNECKRSTFRDNSLGLEMLLNSLSSYLLR